MRRKVGLSTSITIMLSLLTILCLLALYFISSFNVTRIMEESSIDSMQSGIDGEKAFIEEFINKSESQLQLYSKSDEVIELLQHQENAKMAKKAVNYTARYFASLPNWEGLYTASWDTKVLAHSNSKAIGMVLRKGDSLTSLQNSMLGNEVYNTGIIVSPASKKLCLSMYSTVYDPDSKKPIGYVGGATLSSELGNRLKTSRSKSLEHCSFTMMNTSAGNYIFNGDDSKIGSTVKEPEMVKLMNSLKKKTSDSNNVI